MSMDVAMRITDPPEWQRMEHPNLVHESFIGKVVESVWIRKDREAIALVFTDGTQHHMRAEDEDGYAVCWIEAIDDLGFKGRFLGVGAAPDREHSTAEQPSGEVLEINFYDFRTEHGRLLVELRSSSNGYYSGKLVAAVAGEIDAEWKQVE